MKKFRLFWGNLEKTVEGHSSKEVKTEQIVTVY